MNPGMCAEFLRRCALAWLLLALPLLCRAGTLTITPTTSLAAETSNNTSAANSFTTSSNGNLRAGNVSKVDHHTLLYSGATTKIYTNVMYWFGPSNHIQVGYNSMDAVQVQRQVDDHLSRGLNGAIVDWYGPGHIVDDTATQMLKQYAETLPGVPFQFAIMEDKGALSSCANTTGCDLNAQLISDLKYIYSMYQGSPAYLRIDGRPLVFFFGLERYSINWDYVFSNTPGNPLFIFQNSSGFWHADSGGAYSWVQINTGNPDDWQQSYLDYFYNTALSYPTKHTFGTAYKGFNDTMASWSLNRIMNQNCGQTWLKSWKEAARYYSSSNQLEAFQIVTWNDYEEGTEIESGIENCVSVSGAVSGSTLTWTISGQENTIDHYRVFVSTDGQNLMPLATVSAGLHSVDLAQFSLGAGNYVLYVKAVGRPSMANKMSSAISFPVANAPSAPAGFQLTATPTSATLRTGQPVILTVAVTPQNGFSSPVTLACSGLPAGATYSWSNTTVTPAASATLTITLNSISAGLTQPSSGNKDKAQPKLFFAFSLPMLGIVITSLIDQKCDRNRRRVLRLAVGLALLLAVSTLCLGCGGGSTGASTQAGTSASQTRAESYTITITGVADNMQQSTSVLLSVQN